MLELLFSWAALLLMCLAVPAIIREMREYVVEYENWRGCLERLRQLNYN